MLLPLRLSFLFLLLLNVSPASARSPKGADAAAEHPFTVTLDQVNEVCLLGLADLDYWTTRLREEQLHPAVRDGRAQLLICTFHSSWKGKAFGESPLSIYTTPVAGGADQDGAFLLQAYNTSGFFAWVERRMFRSPYDKGDVSNGGKGAASHLTVKSRGKTVIDAQMHGKAEPIRQEEVNWQGEIHLPKHLNRGAAKGKRFRAQLSGFTTVYPFTPGLDVLTLGDPAIFPAIKALQESHFTGLEWWIRPAGRHAKSENFE